MDTQEYRLSVILYTDFANIGRDPHTSPESTREYIQIMQKNVANFGGKPIQDLDNALLVDFPNTIGAINCAIGMQKECRKHGHTKAMTDPQLKIAIHVGNIHFFERGASGEGIDVVTRLHSMASPGKIYMSEDVYNLINKKIDGIDIQELGVLALGDANRDIRVYELSDSGDPDESQPKQPHFTIPDSKDFPYNVRRRQYQERGSSVPFPDRRGYDEDDKADKQVERAWDHVLNAPSGNYQDQQLIQQYRKQTYQGLKRMESGFRGHLASYLTVSAGILALWFFTGATLPWFFFPMGGWGIGLSSHYFNLRRKRRDARELQALPALNRQQLKKLRKYHKVRNKFADRVVSTISVSIFLFGINLFALGNGPFWSFIPIGILSAGLVFNFPKFRNRKKVLLSDLADMGVPVHQLERAGHLKISFQDDDSTDLNPMQAEAERLRAAILMQISNMKDRSCLGENFEQVLDDYVKQVMTLSKKDEEIYATLGEISLESIKTELVALQRQHEQTGNPDIKVELERSMESIEKQQYSYYELQRHQQLLKARLSAAINSLRQLQLDLVRMRQTSEIDELKPVDILVNQTGEISDYLFDLEAEYHRLEELEKMEKKV